MKLPAFLALLLPAGFFAVTGCLPEKSVAAAMAAPPSVQNGKHIVENVAMCADCHTPRKRDGAFDEERWMQGAALDFKPLIDMPWAPAAPAIAGLPGYTDDEAVALFTTGKSKSEQPLRPPMPSYRFTEQEARDVVAYLRSLTPKTEL